MAVRILQGKAVGRVRFSELSVKPKISVTILDDSETNTVGMHQLTQLQQPGEIRQAIHQMTQLQQL